MINNYDEYMSMVAKINEELDVNFSLKKEKNMFNESSKQRIMLDTILR